MKFAAEKAMIVSECLGSTLDEIALRLQEDTGYRPVIDDGIVMTEMENLVLIDTDKCRDTTDTKDIIDEIKGEFLRHDPAINLDTTVIFKL